MDLNLLLTFHVLMTERHVTRSAVALNVTQSAVSANLARLRTTFGDDLFRRTRNGMEPTRRAHEISRHVTDALAAISKIAGTGEAFDPAADAETFVLAMSDDIEAVGAPGIVGAVQERDLKVRMSIRQTNRHLWQDAAADPAVDVVIIGQPDEPIPAEYHKEVLFSSTYACVYDRQRIDLEPPIGLDDFLRLDQVRVTFNGQRALLDDLFAAQGIHRRIIGTFTHFAGALTSLRSSKVLMALPAHAAPALAAAAGLTVSPLPVPTPWFTVIMLWRIEREADPRHQWLLGFLGDLLQDTTAPQPQRQTPARAGSRAPRAADGTDFEEVGGEGERVRGR